MFVHGFYGGPVDTWQRFPESVMTRMGRDIGQRVHDSAPQSALWHGRQVFLVDGTGLSMPDTAANDAEYPRPMKERNVVGFPLLRAAALISLATGAVVDLAITQYIGKGTSEFALLRSMMPTLKPGSVLVGDKLYGAYIVLADLAIFRLLGVVAVLPGLGSSDSGTAAAARAAAARTPPARTPPAEPIADLGYPGRFAIYDPDQLNGPDLSLLGAPDLNVISHTPSVQGYSSLVSGFYASATGSHRATGDGQDVLDPRAVRTGVLDQLDTSVLLTVPAYLTTRSGAAAAGRAAASPGSPA